MNTSHFFHIAVLAVLAAVCGPVRAQHGGIRQVEAVSVTVPEGCVPRLPYRLWVTYADGHGEYRQVRWQNSSPVREQDEADSRVHPVGTTYQVRGFITGSDATLRGYPLTANVRVVGQQWGTPERIPKARPLPLTDVKTDGQNRLSANRELDTDNLLSLDPLQQLYNYRDTYGLSTYGYPVSDGWDSPTTKLKGHGTGHYLSALALAFASSTDSTKRSLLRERMRMMVNQMRECQERTFTWSDSLGRYFEARDVAPGQQLMRLGGSWADFDRYKRDYRHYGYGYLNAIPPQHCTLVERYCAYNNDQGVWAPYYTVHKQLAGLIDIATYTDDAATAAKALAIGRDMGLWVWNRMHYCTFTDSLGTQEERRRRPGNRYEMWNMYIAGEVGGMGESLARLSQMMDDSTASARLLEAAACFHSPAFADPLARGIDAVRTRHANQHIPMIIGSLSCFQATGEEHYYHTALNFWLMMQGRYRYAMGGVGNGEMFRQPYAQMAAMLGNRSSRDGKAVSEPTMNETCCAYNLAKLTRDLNCYHPNDAAFMDYYERLLYNQIVGSVNPSRYETTYQYAVGLNASKPWGNSTPQSTCCGGTGSESHVKYQEAAYYAGADTLWVALYMPTIATWAAKGVTIRQQCPWPAEHTAITVSPQGKSRSEAFTMRLRVPYWATEGFTVRLNGKVLCRNPRPGTYVEIPNRRWRSSDRLEIDMPFAVHVDFGPDKADGHWLGTLMLGPLVMATSGISEWTEASATLLADMSNVQRISDVSIPYGLRLDGRTFLPDYCVSRDITHYLRLSFSPADSLPPSMVADAVYTDDLTDLLAVAEQRSREQQAWQQRGGQTVHAPWARYGFARMTALADSCRLILTADKPSQLAIDAAAETLSTAINSMRPGNLPELEDVAELTRLVEQARQAATTDAGSSQMAEAIAYATMVIRYVSDGSGTYDMIERATRMLKEAGKTERKTIY